MMNIFRPIGKTNEFSIGFSFLSISARQANLNFETLFEELPVVFRNSHLVNSLLCEIDEQTRVGTKTNAFLDLGTR